MKTLKILVVLVVAGSVALAAPSPKQKAAGAGKTAKPAAQAPAAKTPSPKPAQHARTSPMAPKHGAAKPAPAAETAHAAAPAGRGKRDPFVSPVIARGPGPGPCAGGKRCLAIDQLEVHGVVKGPRGWIAIVENPAKKTYFLNDNDELYDGSVVKITGDSVIFKQNVLDAMGHTSTRQIEKKLVPGPAA